VQWNREFEARLPEPGGRNGLRSYTYYNKDGVRKPYDREKGWYDNLRIKHFTTSLPKTYEKYTLMSKKGEKSRTGRGFDG